jgi:hypothetical protein
MSYPSDLTDDQWAMLGVVAVDVTGLPVAAVAVPASTHENRASELMLEHLTRQGVMGWQPDHTVNRARRG